MRFRSIYLVLKLELPYRRFHHRQVVNGSIVNNAQLEFSGDGAVEVMGPHDIYGRVHRLVLN